MSIEAIIARECAQAHFYAKDSPPDTRRAVRQHRLSMLSAWADRVIQLHKELVWREDTACR